MKREEHYYSVYRANLRARGGVGRYFIFFIFCYFFQHVKKLLTVACPFNSTPKVLVFVEKLKITNDSNKSPQNSSSITQLHLAAQRA